MEVAASRKKPTRPKRPPGRPSKLTQKVAARIEELLVAGCSMREVATVVGLDYSTVKKWLQRGREAKSGEYFAFFTRVTRARERCTASLTEFIQKAAPEDWRAAAWMLERRAPKRWTKTQSVEVSGKGGRPIELQTDEAWSRIFQDPEAIRLADELAQRVEAERAVEGQPGRPGRGTVGRSVAPGAAPDPPGPGAD
jgi:transposase